MRSGSVGCLDFTNLHILETVMTFLNISDNEIWICKPVGMNQGKGIFLIRSRDAIMQLLEEREQKKQQQQKPGRPLMNRIVQRWGVRVTFVCAGFVE